MFAKTVSSTDAATEPAGMHSRRVLVTCRSPALSFAIGRWVKRTRTGI